MRTQSKDVERDVGRDARDPRLEHVPTVEPRETLIDAEHRLLDDLFRKLFDDRDADTQEAIKAKYANAAKVLEAHQHPEQVPDLVVRVTGFSTYFATLSPEQRQMIVDRMIAGGLAGA